MRDNIRNHKLRRIMSTRTIKNLAAMTEAYKWKEKDWAESYFVGWPVEERRMASQM